MKQAAEFQSETEKSMEKIKHQVTTMEEHHKVKDQCKQHLLIL